MCLSARQIILGTAMSGAVALALSNGCSSGGASPPASRCNGPPLAITEPDSVDSLYGDEGSTCGWGTGGVTSTSTPRSPRWRPG